jgi:mycothiol synthase
MQWHAQTIDSTELDDAFLAAHSRLAAAALAAERPTEPPLTREGADEWLQAVSTPARRYLFWAVSHDDVLVGVARLALPGHENSHHAQMEIRVDPAHQRNGAGTALLRAAANAARDEGRTTVSAWVTKDTPAGALAERLGLKPTSTLIIQQLPFTSADPAHWQHPAPAGYRAVRWISPAPDELIEDFADAKTAIHGAPFGSESYQLPTWTVERVRAAETDLVARGVQQRVVVAVHEATGDIVGLTELQFRPERPAIGIQQDTSVRAAHRGHRLGVFIKSEMLRWVAAEAGCRLDCIMTNTAPSNTHINRINEELGFVHTRTAQLVEGSVEALTDRLAQI